MLEDKTPAGGKTMAPALVQFAEEEAAAGQNSKRMARALGRR
jgi:hypothetical protein